MIFFACVECERILWDISFVQSSGLGNAEVQFQATSRRNVAEDFLVRPSVKWCSRWPTGPTAAFPSIACRLHQGVTFEQAYEV